MLDYYIQDILFHNRLLRNDYKTYFIRRRIVEEYDHFVRSSEVKTSKDGSYSLQRFINVLPGECVDRTGNRIWLYSQLNQKFEEIYDF